MSGGPAARRGGAAAGADGRAAPQEAEKPRGGPERPGQEESADDGAGAAGGGAGGGGKELGGPAGGWLRRHLLRPPCLRGSLQNQKLLLENQLLREKTCSLSLENQELRCRLGLDVLKTEKESEPKVSAAVFLVAVLCCFLAEPAKSRCALGGNCVVVPGSNNPSVESLQAETGML